MEQSVSRVSGKGAVARILLVVLLSLLGLTAVGVGQAYAAGVVVKSLTPATGTANGGTVVTISGSGFTGASSVTFGGVQAAFTVTTGIKITATAPPAAANSPAAVSVVVTVGGVQSTPQAPGDDTYTYTWSGAPTVTATGLIPVTATAQTGSNIVVTAAGTWTTGQQVSLAGMSNKLASGIYTTTAGGNGSFTISYGATTTGSGTGVVSPTAAGAVGVVAGGTSVNVIGTNFGGATAVDFGATAAASFTVNSATSITAVAPAGTVGPVDITVTNPTPGTSPVTPSTDTFSYVTTPTVTGLTTTAKPAAGPTGGGTQVTIAGTSFDNVTSVKFGTTAAASYLVNSLTSITAVSPAGTGAVDVTVTTGLGTSATSSADQFTYNGTLAVANGTASYSNSPGTTVPVTATSQTGSTVTLTALGTWTAGQKVGISGFTNGLTAGTYTVLANGTNSFTITFSGAVTAGTGNALILATATPTSVTATSVGSGSVTLTAVGSWFVGQQVYLSGFTNGLTTGNYAVTAGGNGSFTVAGSTTATGTGSAIPYQAQSFNAATLVTGGGTISPTVTVTAQPSSGTVEVEGSQLIYIPAQAAPTSYLEGSNTVWLTSVSTTGTQTATIQVCQTAPSQTCATGTLTYLPAGTGYYVGNQLNASGLLVSVVEDTGSGVSVPANASTGSTFTSVTAPSEANLPSTNSGFTVTGIGGYQSITPVPTGITLVPGTLSVTGGDAATSGKYTATLCTAAMGFVPGTCTANFTGNFHASYPYIETSLNVGTQIPGGSQLSLPTVSATWTVTATSGTLSSYETEFVVTTNVVTIGVLPLDAYPTDLPSFLNQGLGGQVPTYAAPTARWTVNVTPAGNAPTVTGVAPSSGPAAGGTSVAITGTNFTGASAVTFGGTPAASFTVNSATSITAITPAGTAGAADVSVTANSITGTDSGAFTYVAAPTVTSIAPSTGTTAGGTAVTITGTNFTGATAVTIGGTAATGVTVVSPTSITATTPAGSAGAANVAVTTPGGTGSDTGAFTYVTPPTITTVAPSSGTTAGGTSVTITGTNLTGVTSVTVGGNPATGVVINSSTSITAITPAGTAGPASVAVTNGGGTATDTNAFTYAAPATITGVAPNSGKTAGGDSVTITGTNFTGATAVTFGSTAATNVVVVSSTSITATTPAGTGTVNVSVTTPAGTVTDTGAFTYVAAPTISTVSPGAGPTAGGTLVTITGTNFTTATAVDFGSTAATSYTVVSATSITATTPAGTGTVNVTVTSPGGTATATNAYQFTNAPTISSISPTVGPQAGGVTVTVNGNNLSGVTGVSFGTTAATSFHVVSNSQLTAVAPAGSPGTVDITVTNGVNTSPTSPADQFTYAATPTVTSVAPAVGTTAGGTAVTITGTNFTGVTAVTIGGTAATGVTVVSATSITATTPAGAAGGADVVVTTPGGTGT